MQRRMTISIDEAVYDNLHIMLDRGNISKFIEDLIRPHVSGCELKKAYREMAADLEREKEAKEWSESLIQDLW